MDIEELTVLATVRDACKIHPMVNDYRMTEAIENLSDLIHDEGDGREFFARNYVTQGMDALFREGLLRLAGLSDQAAFELAQAMGGGKTHLMTALGLLAKHPHLRAEVLPAELAERLDFGPARIAAFNGRNDPDHYVWGEIAEQLGKADLIRPYWIDGPRGVDEAKWLGIIGDEPTLILLDELPPYLLNATTRAVRGFRCSVKRLMVPPLPAASRPSNSITIFWPVSCSQSCTFSNSA